MRWGLHFVLSITFMTHSACGLMGGGVSDVADTDIGEDTNLPFTGEDVEITIDSFACIDELTKVRSFYITNLLGHQEEALALAQNPVAGEQYPVGTLVQIFPFEAMVKRHERWNPDTQDWEFFTLNLVGSLGDSDEEASIEQRGGAEVTTAFDLNCKECHEKAREYDYLCEDSRGCVEKGFTPEAVEILQFMDPRCRSDTGGWDTDGFWNSDGPL